MDRILRNTLGPAAIAALTLAASLAFSTIFFHAADALPQPAASSNPQTLEVHTESGTVQGTFSADGAVRIFKGIPYAAPPVGELRWKEPQPAPKWEGVKKASEFGPRCMQGHTYDDMIFRDRGPKEDCLYLNVWAPNLEPPRKRSKKSGSRSAALADSNSAATSTGSSGENSEGGPSAGAANLPVMVWIYGGGFQAGSTSEPRQDGQHLAHKGVIVVSMNYRLGIFGFFSHPHLTAESTHHASGNYGLLDQAAALRWVHENIAAFGGDPNNVTIFGESAGSFSVSALMASPLSKDLIHAAIGESGAFFGKTLHARSLEESESRNAVFAEELHMPAIGQLRGVSAERLLAAALKGDGNRFGPIVDGYFLPASAEEIYSRGEQAHIPLLAGWNRDEGSDERFLGLEQATKENYAAKIRRQFGDSSAEGLKLFPGESGKQISRSAALLSTAEFIGYGTWKWIEIQLRTGGKPVFRYEFDQAPPAAERPGAPPAAADAELPAYHSAEIEFVFGTLDSKPLPWRAEDYKVSESMMTYWTTFAKTGDPNGTGVATWPAYTMKDGFQVLHLGAKPHSAADEHRQQYEFLDQAWAKAPTQPN